MKGKLLVTTAALALMISAGANAQTRSETKPDQPAATQSQKERGSAKEMNRDNDRAKGAQTTGQTPSAGSAPSAGKAADDTKSGERKPASAQDNTAKPNGNAAQSTDKANDKTNAATKDDKSTSPDRSKQANEPRDNKTNTAAGKTDDSKTGSKTDSKQPSAAQNNNNNSTAPDRNQATTNSKTNDANRAADSKSEPATRVSATLKTEQKTRLQQAVTKLDVKPVTNVNFSISVGTAVPRTVTLHRVPSTIVEIVPQYRDYDYFVVREEVIIVHPETHKIVDVIERGGSSRASVTTTREKRVNLSDKQRSYIRQHATSRRTTTTTTTTGAAPRGATTIVVGEEVPQTVEIETFPEDVYREVPTVREYRYVRSGSDVYLVDPGSRRVIEEIR